MYMFYLAEQRSNESLRSGTSSIYSGTVYSTNDTKGVKDTSTAPKPVATRRSSITSIKSFTAMLPSVPETEEGEPNISDSSSAIHMKLHSSSEVLAEGRDVSATDNTLEVEIVETAIGENSSIKSENEGKDNGMETTNNEGSPKQELSASKDDAIPDIQIDMCKDVAKPVYDISKRRMSKSCDQLYVHVTTASSSSKWKSWSNFLSTISNTVTRVRHGLSNSTGHGINDVGLSNSVGHIDLLVDSQNNQIPEETQDAI